ncbi:nucleotidyltransferase domain-containing protein [Aureibacter tunicatorum]|uniref:Nucleotidyltransferase domain-containing protein n=1 Tax=Aureibacter tunicatorum TaxID=866807 RepID=A0AAE3XIL6_9BACT|nr:nucleotidyltransferase domain-containing protein [Aureibacter tunicatorum]MDR6237110.1 hypothetical protein [Aureibacter tunicatorum]BDD06102.1 hypothetical protein AUTU_35850 [Aureibacter tunicatorum]
MKNKIIKYINSLETEKEIKILLACETGSRAWGFPSPDSDYDVRIIYKHNKEWYLSLNEEKDSITVFYEDNEIDISGWDIRKSLRLMKKSNAPLLERIQSPTLYKGDQEFIKEINDIAKANYSRIATIHHYLNLAKKKYEEISFESEYKLKSFFYALRSATACLWILEKEEIPPIEFPKMLEGLELQESLVMRINELIEVKAKVSESYRHKGEKELFEYMQNCIERAEIEGKNLPTTYGCMDELNVFFRKVID